MESNNTAKKRFVGVNEDHLRRIVSGEAFENMDKEDMAWEITENRENPNQDGGTKKGQKLLKSQKELSLTEYEQEFLAKKSISDKRQVSVALNVENVEFIRRFLGLMGKVSFSVFVDNVVSHHLKTFKEIHSELIKQNLKKLERKK